MNKHSLKQIKERSSLDINKPVTIPDAKVPLPDKTKGKASSPWRHYMKTPRGRRWMMKERYA